ncbi:type I phosphomannose isomerase catalytic subunit [Alienimonas chondri]|uniref:Phosphohexomutase n=1 Tax=Alienimonas chondri TaxID=2681879 RepID=A0ABX1VAM9_9PLAN|nr:type I phosphomannose isomerase catalytic subunit [Alienimonas chondri]NNJ24486.1 Mannose-6-phosphate isomerase ManA [Alienimonas chondri]
MADADRNAAASAGPLEPAPILKRIRWGGTKLGSLLGKDLGEGDDWAESWEVADHGDDQSVVTAGQYAGWSLGRLVAERPRALFGRHATLPDGTPRTQFPLLIKFLDAADTLSVQVHPNDEQAKTYDPSENGKTEAWVIVDAERGASLYAGLKPETDADALRAASEAGSVEDLLHRFEVEAGDCVFIPAGTVHAIGAGIVLAEIQQSSDLTFRLYDWGYRDPQGNPRQIHLDESIACTDFNRGPVDPVSPRPLKGLSERSERLVEGEYFVIDRHTASAAFPLPSDDRFRVLMTLSGSATLLCERDSIELPTGKTVLIPADCKPLTVEPAAGGVTLLESYLPS